MIKLKDLITEITDHDFDFHLLRKDTKKSGNKVKAALNKAGIKGLDVRGPIQHTVALQNNPEWTGTMFIHYQYRYIKGKDGKTYFIHESQYYLSDYYDMPKINLTKIGVSEYPNYPDDKGEKDIGSALVFTDQFLNAAKKVEVLKRG